MIIISDTSPISNLLRIGQLALLQKLYGRVMSIKDLFFQAFKN